MLLESFGSDQSKENMDVNISKEKNRDKSPKRKKRRIVLVSDSEASEDEYKPGEHFIKILSICTIVRSL